ncbi:hypothetical protein bpr_II107 (plasmid) [Butyrivibrio proteoclasticus B316]|uniref:Uncharacterized protein n=1 Tax=Butyrivibrio proteoclasticus (strain ATCC 51982 / DSM 14932 / B316) TaxID=515622 RepID=E0S3R4_BUTPB|nr:hypothetical protein [Butyrivibrio proteoclasticus]ADL36046.1 hypothetical protein bpr_II107 [Butyrivibrio proteoclasticus B316]
MRKTIREDYYHITGMQAAKERDYVKGDPNYIRASLCYDSKRGYYADIRPVYKFTLDGSEMTSTSYGAATPSLTEVLVECSRQSKKSEAEAIKTYEYSLVSAITDRLKYKIDLEEVTA